jgi:hypothetical protein
MGYERFKQKFFLGLGYAQFGPDAFRFFFRRRLSIWVLPTRKISSTGFRFAQDNVSGFDSSRGRAASRRGSRLALKGSARLRRKWVGQGGLFSEFGDLRLGEVAFPRLRCQATRRSGDLWRWPGLPVSGHLERPLRCASDAPQDEACGNFA